MDPSNIPNFNEQTQNRGFLREERLEKLKFIVANITDYYENEETLVDHIRKVSYHIFLVLEFWFSIYVIDYNSV